MQVYPDQIPLELKALESFILWENFNRGDGKMSKSPVLSAGAKTSYDTAEALMPFESAKEKLSKAKDLGLGVSLLGGIKVNVDKAEGYLWCLDFDGFAKSDGDEVDDGVVSFVESFPSYTEISPSGTGFKYFFVCDRVPQSKYKIKFGPSEFADEYPDVTKYVHREIEVFSCNGFLTLTGHLFSPSTGAIKFLSSAELDTTLDHLNNWATSTGGSGTTTPSKPAQTSISTSSNTSYSKLSKSSLEAVLACVDHVDEQVWSDTVNVLARVYGEEGCAYFQSYSSGDYAGITYPDYNCDECNARFDRALNELKGKPDGYGITYLVNSASNHPDWQNPKLEYEEVNPFEGLVPKVAEAKCKAIDIVVIGKEDPFSEDASQSLLERVRGFSITGKSTELREKMLSDVFIMDRIAILGQWTAIYAAPGTGKTLLTLWMLRDQISKGLIHGNQVFYVNADDNYKGMTEKLEIAEKFGLQVLVPNFNGFTVDQMLPLMISLAKSGQAHGVIFVLDTLKKFTDLMDKRMSSQFGNAARQFITAGGSLIVLAHTNKHKDAEGKGIYSGTSDIVDDADCVFIIDKVGECEEFAGKEITVEFSSTKSRGDVASTLGFTYSKGGQSYLELLDSVKRVDEKSLEGTKIEIEKKKQLGRDAEIIEATCFAINAGIRTKDLLIKEVKKITAEPISRVKDVIANRAGKNYEIGHRWSVTPGDNNAQVFSALPTPYILNN
jgi:hypothetical protein